MTLNSCTCPHASPVKLSSTVEPSTWKVFEVRLVLYFVIDMSLACSAALVSIHGWGALPSVVCFNLTHGSSAGSDGSLFLLSHKS
jgi:hypothetical protein